MGKRSKEKVSKKERRRVEAAALARSTWLTETAGLTTAASPATAPRPTTAAARHTTAGGSIEAPEPVPAPRPIDAPGPATRTTGPDQSTTVEATELAARLAGLSTVLQREMGHADTGDGLTRARLSALSMLVLGGPRALGDLAEAEHVRPPTMTRLVHAMEADGLVLREPHPTDGRRVIIRATAAGEQLLGQGRAQQIASLTRAIADLDDGERQQLTEAADLLGRVLRSAGQETGDRPA